MTSSNAADSNTPLRAAIVGAGISGLRAAEVLKASGAWGVHVFDKARGVGGRTSLRRSDPHAFDHGAQYFTARDAGLRGRVDQWVAAGVVAPFDGPLAAIPREGQVEFRDPSSAAPTERFVGVPGMNAMAKNMADGLEITTRARVASLEKEPEGGPGRWALRFVDGHVEHGFDVVLVTTPAAQASPLVAASDALRSAADAVTMSPCWAAMVAFGERYDVPFDGAFIEEGPLSWACRNSAKSGRPEGDAWVLHATPEWTSAHLEASPEDAARQLVEALGQATGSPCPSTVHRGAHRWMYSGAQPPREDGALFDQELGLGLAGDWLNGSKVQGAWLSGQALAEQVLGACRT